MKKPKFREHDFTVKNLPTMRKALFFDLLKHKFKTFLLIGFVAFLFFLPAMIADIFFDIQLFKMSLDSNLVVGETLTEVGYDAYKFSVILFAVSHLITYPIAFIGLAGLTRVIKLLCWNEGVLFWEDFWIGIKQNTKQFLVISLFFSLGMVPVYLTRSYLGSSITNQIISGIAYGLAFGIINPFAIMGICYSATYSIKTGKAMLNSFVLYVKNFFLMLLFSAFTFGYFAFVYIPIPFVIYLAKLVSIIVLLPILLIAIYLRLSNSFDKSINKFAHPELVNKGLYKKETNE